jgi:hypothetical protein
MKAVASSATVLLQYTSMNYCHTIVTARVINMRALTKGGVFIHEQFFVPIFKATHRLTVSVLTFGGLFGGLVRISNPLLSEFCVPH